MEVHDIVQETGIKTISMEKKRKKKKKKKFSLHRLANSIQLSRSNIKTISPPKYSYIFLPPPSIHIYSSRLHPDVIFLSFITSIEGRKCSWLIIQDYKTWFETNIQKSFQRCLLKTDSLPSALECLIPQLIYYDQASFINTANSIKSKCFGKWDICILITVRITSCVIPN